ncbi:MAG: FAD-dependent oxidoreductase [Chloroflexia bacterium]
MVATNKGRRVAVIGAGLGGLGTAALLARQGYAVSVFEKNEQSGGRASLLQDAGFMGYGASWPNARRVRALLRLLGECGGSPRATATDAYRMFFEDGDTVDMTGVLDEDAATFESYEPGAADRLREYLRLSEYQYDIAMRDFVPKNYDSFRDFLTPTVMRQGPKLHVFESMDRYVARFFTHPKLRKIVQYTLVFLGSSPYSTPALYNIMAHVDFNLGVWYPNGGVYELVRVLERIAIGHGAEFHCSSPVEEIVVQDGRVSGVRTPRGIYPADIVVSNADLAFTETRLVEPRYRTYGEKYWRKRTLAPLGVHHVPGGSGQAARAGAPQPLLLRGLEGELRPTLRPSRLSGRSLDLRVLPESHRPRRRARGVREPVHPCAHRTRAGGRRGDTRAVLSPHPGPCGREDAPPRPARTHFRATHVLGQRLRRAIQCL